MATKLNESNEWWRERNNLTEYRIAALEKPAYELGAQVHALRCAAACPPAAPPPPRQPPGAASFGILRLSASSSAPSSPSLCW